MLWQLIRGSNRKCHEGQGSRLPLNEEYDAEDKLHGKILEGSSGDDALLV